jgi:hypothetical protein
MSATATLADELITPEIIRAAVKAGQDVEGDLYITVERELVAVLRVVAPMIAERVAELDAQIADSMDIYGHIAAGIRARWEGRP